METLDRQLRYFLRIAELGSLSRAAEELQQNQSWISKQLASLEQYLGKPVFLRNGRGVVLTQAGKELYERIRQAYVDIDLAVETIRSVQGISQGTVRLATVHTLSYYFTAEVVASFISTHPDVNISVMGRSSPEVVALVESGKADLGFVYESAVDSGILEMCTLFEDTMCLIVRQELDLHGGQDLTHMPLRLVGFPSHYTLRRMIHSSGLKPDFVAEAETIDAMLKLVSSGVGACILPSRIPDKLLAEYHLRKIPITAPTLRRRVAAITLAGKFPMPLVKELLDCTLRISRLLGAHESE